MDAGITIGHVAIPSDLSANLRAKVPELFVSQVSKIAGPGTPAKADSSPLKQFGMTRSKEFSGIQIRDVQGTPDGAP
jgi:hypothetical protein